jgi:hypothetical protein
MRIVLTLLALLCGCHAAFADRVPLPRAKPASPMERYEFSRAPTTAPSAIRHSGLITAQPPSSCVERLAKIAQFASLPEVTGPGECGIADVVRLENIVMPDGSMVAVSPYATLGCPMAEALAQWMRDIGPAANEFGSPPAAITNQSAYVCRGRNGNPAAKLSEHGRGNALDVASIKLANGRLLDLTNRSVSEDFRRRVRDAACDRFATVLGPGSDRFHETHVHLDLAERKNGYSMCQWNIDVHTASDDASERTPMLRSFVPARGSKGS